MKKIHYIFMILFALTFSSCNDGLPWVEDCSDYDYSDCNQIEPDSTNLVIKATIDNIHSNVPITIYRGTVDNGIVLYSGSMIQSEFYFKVPVNENYAVKAIYKIGNKTIISVDGDFVKKKSKRVCDATCWAVVNNEMDVRLSQ